MKLVPIETANMIESSDKNDKQLQNQHDNSDKEMTVLEEKITQIVKKCLQNETKRQSMKKRKISPKNITDDDSETINQPIKKKKTKPQNNVNDLIKQLPWDPY